jgi:hypothetical protein
VIWGIFFAHQSKRFDRIAPPHYPSALMRPLVAAFLKKRAR